jgi:23S rRNA (adenine-N6)-dimethyltransferase
VAGRVRSAREHREHGGAHFLRDRLVAAELVRHAGLRPGDLVLDLGAGGGAITAPLAATGARVLAVELNQRFASRLERRFERTGVRVIHGDLRTMPLPHRPYRVVASIPFAVTTRLLRRLLDDPRGPLLGADLLVEWGVARRLTAPVPRDLATAWWAARFDLRLRRRVPAACFSPPPKVDAAHLQVRPRALASDPAGQRLLRGMLRDAFAHPSQPLRAVAATSFAGTGLSHRRLGRVLATAGLDPGAAAASPTGAQWHDLTLELLAAGRATSPASNPARVARRNGVRSGAVQLGDGRQRGRAGG